MDTSLLLLLCPQFRPPALQFRLRIPHREIIRDRANSPPCPGPAVAVFSAVWRSLSSALHFCCIITVALNFTPCLFIGGRFFLLFLGSSNFTNALPTVTSLALLASPPVKFFWCSACFFWSAS